MSLKVACALRQCCVLIGWRDCITTFILEHLEYIKVCSKMIHASNSVMCMYRVLQMAMIGIQFLMLELYKASRRKRYCIGRFRGRETRTKIIDAIGNMFVFFNLNALNAYNSSIHTNKVPKEDKLLLDETLVLLVRLVPVAVFLLRYQLFRKLLKNDL
jgi:hypothetical protein